MVDESNYLFLYSEMNRVLILVIFVSPFLSFFGFAVPLPPPDFVLCRYPFSVSNRQLGILANCAFSVHASFVADITCHLCCQHIQVFCFNQLQLFYSVGFEGKIFMCFAPTCASVSGSWHHYPIGSQSAKQTLRDGAMEFRNEPCVECLDGISEESLLFLLL